MLTTTDVKFLTACGIAVYGGELHPALSTQDVDKEAVRVCWRFWEITQSQYHFRGQPNEIDLGEIT